MIFRDLSFKRPLSFTSFGESSHPKAFTFGTIGSGRLTLKSYPHDVHVVKTKMSNVHSSTLTGTNRNVIPSSLSCWLLECKSTSSGTPLWTTWAEPT